jgi:hypothetical protein
MDKLEQIKALLTESSDESVAAKIRAIMTEGSKEADEDTEPADHEDVLPDELTDADDLEKLFAEASFDILVAETSLKPLQESITNGATLSDLITEAAAADGEPGKVKAALDKIKDKLRSLANTSDPNTAIKELQLARRSLAENLGVWGAAGASFYFLGPLIGLFMTVIAANIATKSISQDTLKAYIAEAKALLATLEKAKEKADVSQAAVLTKKISKLKKLISTHERRLR